MNNTQDILLLILIGLFANANDLNLANNTTILLLLALLIFNGGLSLGTNNNCSSNRIVL